jgi:hypothetical protein
LILLYVSGHNNFIGIKGMTMRMLFVLCFVVTHFISSAHAQLSLKDLGMPETVTVEKQDPKLQFEMKERKSKLKTHEVLGLTTLGAMTATLLTGNTALDSNVHMYLGITTAALYFTTAYYSLTAPKPSGVIDRGRIKWHKALAWIHFPAMIITPILGYMYRKHEDEGKKHGSLEKQHTTFAGILYGSFALSASLMVIEF